MDHTLCDDIKVPFPLSHRTDHAVVMSCQNDTQTRSQGPSNPQITKSYRGYHSFIHSFELKPGRETEAAETLDAFRKANRAAATLSDDSTHSDPYPSEYDSSSDDDDDEGSSISSYSSVHTSDSSTDSHMSSSCPDSPTSISALSGSSAIFEKPHGSVQSDNDDDYDDDGMDMFLEDEGIFIDGRDIDTEDDLDDLDYGYVSDVHDDGCEACDNIGSDPSDGDSDGCEDLD